MAGYSYSVKEMSGLGAALEQAVASVFAELQKRTKDPMILKVLAFIQKQEDRHAVALTSMAVANPKAVPTHEYEADVRALLMERIKAMESLRSEIAVNQKGALEKTLAKVGDIMGENIGALRRLREGYPAEFGLMLDSVLSEDKKYPRMLENVRRRLTLPDPMSMLDENQV